MTLTARMILQMEAAQAKGVVEENTRAIKALTAALNEQAVKSKAATGAADGEAAAKRRNAQASREMATANRQAAGATGNLVAQFNDIGMMMAAGQNPLQLAIQQGTQITQVIGAQGAAGAVGLLKTAFVQMLNPLNLFTIGAIAAGAAAIQWLTGAQEEARSLEDQIEAVTTTVSDWREESEKSFTDLRESFGRITPELLDMQRELTNLRIRQVMLDAAAATKALSEEMNGSLWSLSTRTSNVAELLGVESGGRGGQSAELREIISLLDQFDAANGIQEQLAATQALREAFAEAVGGTAKMNDAQTSFYNSVLNTEAALRAAAVATGDVRQEIVFTGQTADGLKGKIDLMAGTLASMTGLDISGIFADAQGPANELLGIVGRIVTGMSQAVAWQSAQRGQLAAQYALYGSGRVIGERLARESGDLYGNEKVLPDPPKRRGGGGASEAEKQDKALKDLITSLNAEIEALRTQDPIQEEMLKHRKALTGATEAERQKVEELIKTREREAMLMEGAKARAEFFEDIGTQALDALIMKGESFNDVLKGIISSLIKAIAQAALFGSGPFGSLFGGTSILSGLFGGIGVKAEGGMVHGPGTGTSDSIPTMLSNGEFVVNARSTARNRHLLEAINSGGRIAGYATGGYVGADSRRLAARGGRDLPASIYIDLRGSNGDQAIEEKVRRGAAEVVSLYDRDGLPVSMQRVSGDPRRRG